MKIEGKKGESMKRQKIKEILLDMGASAKLLEMPAVMERIYNYYIDFTEDRLRKEINIGPNGEIECKVDISKMYPDGVMGRFSATENGGAVYEKYGRDDRLGGELAGKYFIDEFGMDREFISRYEPLFEVESRVTRTEDGTIDVNRGERVVEDQGDPILNYSNYTLLREKFSRTIGWEGNKDFLTKYYPITKQWFEMREGVREETVNSINERKEIEEKQKEEEEEKEKLIDSRAETIKTITSQNPELDEPKAWRIKSRWVEGGGATENEPWICIMTERQKRILERTRLLRSLTKYYLVHIYEIEEIPENELTDTEKTRIKELKQEIESIKHSTDPKLDRKGIYKTECSKRKYERFYDIDLEVETTLRQALLATTPETRDCFKPYTRMEDFSKITLKSIKDAIKNSLNIGKGEK